jgi:hypothetical protein
MKSMNGWSAPAIKSPDDNRVNVSAPRSFEYFVAHRTLFRPGANFFYLQRHLPFVLLRVLAHRLELHW